MMVRDYKTVFNFEMWKKNRRRKRSKYIQCQHCNGWLTQFTVQQASRHWQDSNPSSAHSVLHSGIDSNVVSFLDLATWKIRAGILTPCFSVHSLSFFYPLPWLYFPSEHLFPYLFKNISPVPDCKLSKGFVWFSALSPMLRIVQEKLCSLNILKNKWVKKKS